MIVIYLDKKESPVFLRVLFKVVNIPASNAVLSYIIAAAFDR